MSWKFGVWHRINRWFRSTALMACVLGTIGFLQAGTNDPLFRFVQLSDGHLVLPEEKERIKDWGGRLLSRSGDALNGAADYISKDIKPAFVVYTGDMVENGGWEGGLKAMEKVKSVFSDRQLTLLPVYGNHEVAEDKFQAVFGKANYSAIYGNLLIVSLQAYYYYPRVQRREDVVPKEVLYQLDEVLASYAGYNVIVVMHQDLVCDKREETWARPANYDLIIRLLHRYSNVVMVLQGHAHMLFHERRDEIDYVIGQGLVETENPVDPSLKNCLMVYSVYPDRIDCAMHGASSTDEAAKGRYALSSKVAFSVPGKKPFKIGGGYSSEIRIQSLPNVYPRYDPEIEQAMSSGVACYLSQGWKFRTDPEDLGMKQGWQSADVDESAWKGNFATCRYWEVQLAPNYDGVGWYRVHFTIPDCYKTTKLEVLLGRLDDSDETYLNGKPIGKTGEFPPAAAKPESRATERCYPLPADLVRFGSDNVLAIRVYDAGEDGGMSGFPFVRYRGCPEMK